MSFNAIPFWGMNKIFFKPTDLNGLVIWLDASDSTTIVEVSGGVNQWSDKSGNNHHFTAAASGNRPTYNSNDKKITFNGTSHYLRRTSTNAINAKPSTDFIVLKSNITTTGQFVVLADRTDQCTGFSGYGRLFYDNFADTTYGTNPRELWTSAARNISCAFRTTRHTNKSSGKNELMISTLSWTNDGNICMRYNGILQSDGEVGTWPSSGTCNTDATVSAGTHDRTHIGANTSNTPAQFYPGDIYEIIRYNRSLTSQEREKVERYLANKWGIIL